jgi:hypothetical protein
MATILEQLSAVTLGSILVLACFDGTTPAYGDGCSTDQQSVVQLEGDTLVAQLYVTRDYRLTDIVNNTARTTHYRTCQQYRCTAVRDDPAAPVTEAESTAALTACRAEADAAWAAEYPT